MPGFDIDERKLRSATPPLDGEWWEGFKWGGAILVCALLFIASAAALALGLFRAFV
jgi:hypothetical protein